MELLVGFETYFLTSLKSLPQETQFKKNNDSKIGRYRLLLQLHLYMIAFQNSVTSPDNKEFITCCKEKTVIHQEG